MLKELYDNDDPNVEALLKDKKNLAKLPDDKLIEVASGHTNSLLVDYKHKTQEQRKIEAKRYWVMWHGMVKLWNWVEGRKPPNEPRPQKHKPLTLESLEYKTNNDKRDLPEWP